MGTPVDIFEDVVNADRVICLGNIEYHYLYSGGAKAIMPGVSTAEAIQANHSRMVQQKADIYIVSDIETPLAESMFFTPFCTVKEALEAVFHKTGESKGIIVMPYGGSTLPAAEDDTAY